MLLTGIERDSLRSSKGRNHEAETDPMTVGPDRVRLPAQDSSPNKGHGHSEDERLFPPTVADEDFLHTAWTENLSTLLANGETSKARKYCVEIINHACEGDGGRIHPQDVAFNSLTGRNESASVTGMLGLVRSLLGHVADTGVAMRSGGDGKYKSRTQAELWTYVERQNITCL